MLRQLLTNDPDLPMEAALAELMQRIEALGRTVAAACSRWWSATVNVCTRFAMPAMTTARRCITRPMTKCFRMHS